MGEADPSPFIHDTIEALSAASATIAVVPCNTAHILYSRWAVNTDIPVVSIIKSALSALPNKKAMKVATLSSKYLADNGLYQGHIAAAGHESVALDNHQQQVVSDAISHLKQRPQLDEAILVRFLALINSLRTVGVEVVILACTELSLLTGSDLSVNPNLSANSNLSAKGFVWKDLVVIDSNTELARASLKAIGIKSSEAHSHPI